MVGHRARESWFGFLLAALAGVTARLVLGALVALGTPEALRPSAAEGPRAPSPTHAGVPALEAAPRPRTGGETPGDEHVSPSPDLAATFANWSRVEEERFVRDTLMYGGVIEQFRARGFLDLFVRMHGPMPVRPLGVPASERLDPASEDTLGLLFESPGSAMARMYAAVSTAPTKAATAAVRVFAFAVGSQLEVVLGRGAWYAEPNPESPMLLIRSAAALRNQRLASDIEAEAGAICNEAHRAHRAAERALWDATFPEIQRRLQAGLDERNVAAVMAMDEAAGGLRVIERGNDGELDRLLYDLGELDRSLREAIEAWRR